MVFRITFYSSSIKSFIFLYKIMTASGLRDIASAGGNVIVDACQYSASDLRYIAEAGKKKEAKLSIKNAKKLSTSDCRYIALENPGNVEFDFSE